MESTIIHIGYHKSASTFLQQQVFPKLPVNYVFFAGEERKYLNMIEAQNGFDPRAIREWVEQEISRKYPTSKHAITVLSHEELSGHPHGYKNISPLTTANNLKETFPNAKILIIIRNQLDYLTSLYTFRVAIKGYETRSFSRFVKEEGEKGLYEHLEYHLLIERYRELFGNDNVRVLPMEMLVTSPDEFSRHLFKALGIPAQNFNYVSAANVSTKHKIVLNFWRPVNYFFGQILYALRLAYTENSGNFPRFRSSYYDLKRKVTAALNKCFAKSEQINIMELNESSFFIPRFAESNFLLSKMLGADLAQFGYPVKNP